MEIWNNIWKIALLDLSCRKLDEGPRSFIIFGPHQLLYSPDQPFRLHKRGLHFVSHRNIKKKENLKVVEKSAPLSRFIDA